jgi:hypothetical protein
MNASPSRFWQTHRGLVWSNPQADDSAHIQAALLRPRSSQVLDISVEFGRERVRQEWAVLEAERRPEVERARRPSERILRHLEEGFARQKPEVDTSFSGCMT